MDDVKAITIDNIEYIVVDEIPINGIKYIYLAEESDVTKFMIRKINRINGMEYIVHLDSKEEFNKALEAFNEKNHE